MYQKNKNYTLIFAKVVIKQIGQVNCSNVNKPKWQAPVSFFGLV